MNDILFVALDIDKGECLKEVEGRYIVWQPHQWLV